MLTPYEIIVKSALPAIRGILVRELYTRYKFKQTEIASSLHITQAAVSYYLTDSRGKYVNVLFEHEDVSEKIRELAREIQENRLSLTELMIKINDIIVYMMKNKYLCDLHKLLESNLDIENCDLCPEISSEFEA
jgi:predicted transcriptional regulator